MNDSEIIKALECLCKNTNDDDGRIVVLPKLVLDLITRQQAEIERLKKIQQTQADRLIEERGQKYEQIEVISKLKKQLKTAKSVAVREFAEKLKEHSCSLTEYDEGGWSDTVSAVKVENIDRLVEEMGCNDG